MTLTNSDFAADTEKQPVLFVGHGSPMNAIEDSEFSRAWAELGQALPRPRAILAISAHWETEGSRVTAMDHPSTIHDFGGFPQELFDVQYPAPGSPTLAELVRDTAAAPVWLDTEGWGLDHGTWSVLRRMYPDANVPVVQLSLDRNLTPEQHFRLAGSLGPLRNHGVLIVGSGNVVHNLGQILWRGGEHSWAVEFDATARDLVTNGDFDSLVHYERLGGSAAMSIPTNEHYLPFLYTLGLRSPNEPISFFCERIVMGSLSMRSLKVG